MSENETVELSTAEKLSIMKQWYWLMCDVEAGEAYRRVQFRMADWGFNIEKDQRRHYAVQTIKPWCGTAACAGGFLAFSGILPGVKTTLNEVRRFTLNGGGFSGESADSINDVLDLLPYRHWITITSDNFNATPGEKAEDIRGVIKEEFKVDVKRCRRPPDLPWEGKQKAFRGK